MGKRHACKISPKKGKSAFAGHEPKRAATLFWVHPKREKESAGLGSEKRGKKVIPLQQEGSEKKGPKKGSKKAPSVPGKGRRFTQKRKKKKREPLTRILQKKKDKKKKKKKKGGEVHPGGGGGVVQGKTLVSISPRP